MVASTFLAWAEPARGLILFGALDRLAALRQTGWQHSPEVSVVLAVLGGLLVALALGGPRRAIRRRTDVRLAILVIAVAVAVALTGFGTESVSVPADAGGQAGVARVGPGPWVALAGCALALAGLALNPRRT